MHLPLPLSPSRWNFVLYNLFHLIISFNCWTFFTFVRSLSLVRWILNFFLSSSSLVLLSHVFSSWYQQRLEEKKLIIETETKSSAWWRETKDEKKEWIDEVDEKSNGTGIFFCSPHTRAEPACEREKSFNQMCMLDFDQIKEGSRIRWWKKYVCWPNEREKFLLRSFAWKFFFCWFIGAVAFCVDRRESRRKRIIAGEMILTCRRGERASKRERMLMCPKLCYWVRGRSRSSKMPIN